MVKRRQLLNIALNLGGAAIAGVVVVPGVLGLLTPAIGPSGPRWRAVGPLASFPVGRVRKAAVHLARDDADESLQQQGVYVWRPAVDEVVVFSRSCTDLGCPVRWDPGSGWFFCPCHGGIFDHEGQRRAGPPRLPLYRYAHRLVAGILEIDLQSVPPVV